MYADIRANTGIAFDLVLYKDKEDFDKHRTHKGFFKIFVEPKDNKVAYIYYMFIKPKYRKQGYASDTINNLKKDFNKLATQESASSEDSIKFLKAHGFKSDGDWLVWKKN